MDALSAAPGVRLFSFAIRQHVSRPDLADGRETCRACKLWALVPADKTQELIPCHYVRLNAQGDTIAGLYGNGTQESLDRAYRGWLYTFLQQLEKQ